MIKTQNSPTKARVSHGRDGRVGPGGEVGVDGLVLQNRNDDAGGRAVVTRPTKQKLKH